MAAPEGNPDHLAQIGFGFGASKCLLAGVELNLFGCLDSAPAAGLTASDIAKELDLHAPRGVPDWLDALVALKLLERDGDGPDARYRNTPTTANYAVPGKIGSMYGILKMFNDRLYKFWGTLEDGLRTGEVQNEAKGLPSGVDMFQTISSDPEAIEKFALAMEGVSHGHNRAFASSFDFSKYTSLADFGGSTGNLVKNVAQCHPHMRCATFDRPEVEPVARKCLETAGVGDRCEAKSLNFFTEPAFPTGYDVIVMGFILHDWGLPRKMMLMKKAFDALPPGGAFAALDATIDDDRRGPVGPLLMSVNMLIEFGKETSFDYTFAEFTSWAKEVGFARTEFLPLPGLVSACIAYKA